MPERLVRKKKSVQSEQSAVKNSSEVDPMKHEVASSFNDTHIAQMLGYLNITDLEVALLLNFKESMLTWKRVVRERNELTTDCTDDADKKQKRIREIRVIRG
jgi:PD-(D/E)XK nuclease superfamily